MRRAATTFPRADRDLLMNLASSIRSGFFSASVILSLPAKSMRQNLETSLVSLSWFYLYCGSRRVLLLSGFMYILI